jgi:hypothetical protein
MRKIFLFLIAFNFSTLAQITITNSDLAAQLNIGNSVTVHELEAPATADIGSPGGGNNWDFTMLQGNLLFDLTCVDPALTPHLAEFPGANIATHTLGEFEGDSAEIWHYATLNGSYDNMGTAVVLVAQPGSITFIKHDPARREMEFPLTYNSSWSTNYTQTVYFNSIPVVVADVTLSYLVDAYGTMTIPGGASFEALRLRESTTIFGSTTVSYLFFTKSGAQVSLFTDNDNPPASGVINLEGYSYSGPFITNAVEPISGVPKTFSLNQNYPNPFNPSTVISYQLPVISEVTLKVYDILGNEMATLVDEYKPAGKYEVEFNAEILTNGVYFYRLTAGEYTAVKKMIFLK